MLTVPTAFANFQKNLAATRTAIVKVTDGTSTWYFSDREMDFGAGFHVYGLLESWNGIKHSVDPFTKQWSVSNVTIQLNNAPYRVHTDGTWKRPSDDLTNIINHTAEIYLMAGETATSLSDCLLRFTGVVEEQPAYDEAMLSFTIADDKSIMETILPKQTLSLSDYPNMPIENEGKAVPLIYGRFFWGLDYPNGYYFHPFHLSALAEGICVDNSGEDHYGTTFPLYVFASHPLMTPPVSRALYFQDSYPIPARFIDPTIYVEASGWYVGAPSTAGGAKARIYVQPSGSNWTGYLFAGYNKPFMPEKLTDPITATGVIVKDNYFDDGVTREGLGAWSFNNDADLKSIISKAYGAPGAGGIGIRYKVADVGTPAGATRRPRFYHSYDGSLAGDFYNFALATFDGTLRDTSVATSEPPQNEAQYLIALYMTRTDGADATLNNSEMFDIDELYLFIEYYVKDFTNLYFSTWGRTYGSWIDAGGRTNLRNQADLIEHGYYIIESLLRDEHGLTDSRIDVASFDTCDTSSHPLNKINLIDSNKATTAKIIKQLAEQGRFVFCQSVSGKYKCIPLRSTIPTTNSIIPFSIIVGGGIKVYRANDIINQLHIEYDWSPNLRLYRRNAIFNNTDSQAIYGVISKKVNWPNIHTSFKSTTSELAIAGDYINNSDALWATAKYAIEFDTAGFLNANLDLGDWIELDATTTDPHLLFNGTTWSGKQFLVISLEQHATHTHIKAVKLW